MSATLTRSPRSTQEHTRRRHSLAIVAASSLALCAFAWPFVVPALPQASQAAAPFVALALVPALVVLASLLMDGSLRSSRRVALLGVLAAVGSIVRIATVGIAGVETIFIVLILAGRAFGARFGFLLGLITIGVSSLIMGSIGPWTPFQMFAAAWVGAGAGLLPAKSLRGWREILLLATYGLIAAYLFGALMNLWFWPFAVGGGTSISYDPSAASGDNLARFGLYTLITSTLTWDTVRALTTVVGISVIGRYVLAALRRSN
jgi:hypothetical protein